MPTYHITEIATGSVAFRYCSDAPVTYGRADWDDPTRYEHVLVPDPAPPPAPPRPIMSKWAFRQLFTLAERVACDSVPDNPAIPAEYRAMLRTLNTDFAMASEIDPALADVQQGVQLLEQLGLIGPGRAAQILFEG